MMPTPDEIAARRDEVAVWYAAHRFKCKLFEQGFAEHLTRLVQDEDLRDARVETRTKTMDSILDKACATRGEVFKYQDPRREITDAVGARVMVPLVTDIEPVRDAIRRRFVVEEESDRGEDEGAADVPGYRSLHLLVRLGEADLAQREFSEFSDMIVEIQIRTILQHAWAALQHDLGYKTDRPPSPAVRRRITALAGLLELADREFVDVKQQQNVPGKPRPAPGALQAPPDGKLTTASLRVYVEEVMGEEDAAAHTWYVELAAVIAKLGIDSTGGLTRFLGTWREKAPLVSSRMRTEKPWANSALVFDMLLRLAGGEVYLQSICDSDSLERTEQRERGFFDDQTPYRELAR